MRSICTEDHSRATIAVAVTSGFVLSRIPDIIDTDGPPEIEFRSADIDVREVLNKLEGPVGENEIVDWQGLEWSTAIGPVQDLEDAASVV